MAPVTHHSRPAADFEIDEQSMEVPIDVTPTWIHGDLHAGNLLLRTGSVFP
jgi:aminoglycoside phosphotransferase (APT) family kinase protein